MKQTSFLFCMLVQLGFAPAWADPLQGNEAEWLKTMVFAAHQTDYSGVFVYQAGGRVEMSRITHVSDDNGEHERLESMGGARRELIRNNDQVWLFSQGRKVKVEKRQLKRAFPALLPEQISTLKENYLIRREEDGEVAGYHVHAVTFQPKDNLRYSRKMWAHYDSGLLLKAAVMDDRGYIIEQYAFMELSIGGNIDRKWISLAKSAPLDATQQAQASNLNKADLQLTDSSGWQVDELPLGFKKILEMRRSFHESHEPVIHMVFSDGLAGISVFVEKQDESTQRHSGLAGQGAVHVYSRVIGDSLVTVVGEVPARTVIQIADSVRYAGQ
jgi:sigma-E factor negative regulatory protein RseB